jgi:WD domain, G-beta repeat
VKLYAPYIAALVEKEQASIVDHVHCCVMLSVTSRELREARPNRPGVSTVPFAPSLRGLALSRSFPGPGWFSVKWVVSCKTWILISSCTLVSSIAIVGGWCVQESAPSTSRRIVGDHRFPLRTAAFSPDGKTVVLGGGSFGEAGELAFWDLNAGHLPRRFTNLNGQVSCLALSPDAPIVVASGYDSVIRIWNYQSGVNIRTLTGHSEPVVALAFAKDNRTLASVSQDQSVRLWDVDSGREGQVFTAPIGWIQSLAFPDEGPVLALGGSDGEVRVFSVTTGQWRAQFPARANIVCMAFSPDCRFLAGGCMDGSVMIWDLKTRRLCERSDTEESPITAVAWGGSGDLLACGSLNGRVAWWGFIRDGDGALSPVTRCPGETGWAPARDFEGHRDAVTALAFSPDQRALASASADRTAILWEVDKAWK